MGQKTRFYYDIQSFHSGVTGSKTLVSGSFPYGEQLRFLIDCGSYQGKEADNANSTLNFDASKIDFVCVTHNHMDHTGCLPLLLKNGFQNSIYASTTTCKLMPPALNDNCRIMRNNAKSKGTKSLYNDLDVEHTIQHLTSCEWYETVRYNDNARFTIFKNGHLVGATLILVQLSYPGYDDINILFTGDYNYKNTFFSVPSLPDWVLELPLTVVCESTYGTMDSSEINYCFDSNVANAINNNATVIAPVFSQGRAQEILYELNQMQLRKTLSIDTPIFLDGNLAQFYTGFYQKCPDIRADMQNFAPKNLLFVDKSVRQSIIEDTKPKIILTTSGSGSYGPAQTYLPEYITRKNALIHFTGFCPKDTLGYKLNLAENGKTVTIGGRILRKSADVQFTSEFSAHAKADELIDFLHQFKDIKLLLVQHGEPEVKKQFAERVVDECSNIKDVGLLGDGYFFRADRYGFVKSIPTKF